MDLYVVRLVGKNEEAGNTVDEYVGLTGNYLECQEWLRENGFVQIDNVGDYWKREGRSFVHHFHEDGSPLSGTPLATELQACIEHVRSFDIVAVRNHYEITPRDSS